MNLKAMLMLFGWSLVITAVVLVLVTKPVAQMNSYLEELQNQGAAVSPEPYGGCDEAWQAPHSAGANWCRANGYPVPLP